MLIDNDFFEHSIRNGDYPSSTCPKCIVTPPNPEKDYGDCPVCLQHAYDWNNIESHVFINNIDSILSHLDDDVILLILNDYKDVVYDCYECSSLDDVQYFCTTCENEQITEVDYILFKLKENNKDDALKRLNSIIDKFM